MANKKPKEKTKEILVPLSVLIEREANNVIQSLNKSGLDIHLKIEVLQTVLQNAINVEQQERMIYEEQLKESEEENGISKESMA